MSDNTLNSLKPAVILDRICSDDSFKEAVREKLKIDPNVVNLLILKIGKVSSREYIDSLEAFYKNLATKLSITDKVIINSMDNVKALVKAMCGNTDWIKTFYKSPNKHGNIEKAETDYKSSNKYGNIEKAETDTTTIDGIKDAVDNYTKEIRELEISPISIEKVNELNVVNKSQDIKSKIKNKSIDLSSSLFGIMTCVKTKMPSNPAQKNIVTMLLTGILLTAASLKSIATK